MRSKKTLLIIAFVSVFFFSLISTIPAWVLGSIVANISNDRLRLYNTTGSFWHGSALLVVSSEKAHKSSPLLLTNWNITAGITKFIDIKFNVGNTQIADLYLNKHGVNLDNLDVSLSLVQLSQLADIVSSFGLSGNLEILSQHILLGNKLSGQLTLKLGSVSSGLSPVNPLGSYQVKFKALDNTFDLTSTPGSNLTLDGQGSTTGLTLTGRIAPDKKAQMLEFITVMGVAQADGSYKMKIY